MIFTLIAYAFRWFLLKTYAKKMLKTLKNAEDYKKQLRSQRRH